MSMTQKEIKDLIAGKESDIEDLKNGYKKFDEYEKLQNELDELLKRKAQIEKEQAEIRVEYQANLLHKKWNAMEDNQIVGMTCLLIP